MSSKKYTIKLSKKAALLFYILGYCILSFGITGCGIAGDAALESLDEMETTVEDDLIVVGFSQLGSESVWRTANTASIQEALTKENGYFLYTNNARQKQENQIKALRGFISQRVDYIIFSPVTEDGWEMVLQEAKDAGIPVILVDRKVQVRDDSLYTTWIGASFREEGERAGAWLEQYLQKQGMENAELNIVILQGTVGSTAQRGRTMGFDTVADRHTNWHLLEQADAGFTTAKAEEVMNYYLEKYPDIDVIVSQNDDMTFGVLHALEKAGKTTGVEGDMALISFDAVHEALELVQEGVINVDIECNPEQGEYVTKVIEALERGETVEKEYLVTENVFTQDNVGDYINDRKY